MNCIAKKAVTGMMALAMIATTGLGICSNNGESILSSMNISASAASITVGTPSLTISSRSTTGVTIKWNRVSCNATSKTDKVGYKIYRYDSSTGKWTTVKTVNPSTDSSYTYTDSVSETKEVKYKARAYYKTSSGTTYFSSYSSEKTIHAYFELPLVGSTGWCGVKMNLYKSASSSSTVLKSLSQGTTFRIVGGSGSYWKVYVSSSYTGYVKASDCLINLPDILPSIQYNITNASSSIYKSSGYSISGTTGKKLYSAGKLTNSKLGKSEYLVPVMYETAKKIAIAQYNARTAGVCLKIYDSYRPYKITEQIRDDLSTLVSKNTTVKNGIMYSYGASGKRYTWGEQWFLAQGTSAHNFGTAIDVTLCKKSGSTYKELTMTTAMHELSTAAIKYYSKGAPKTAAGYSKEMLNCTNAQLLDAIFNGYTFTYNKTKYTFKSTGMSTLASEWWHFQDDTTLSTMRDKTSNTGFNFQVTKSMSKSL